MLLSIEGQEKTGKTGFLFTAPLPIVSFQFDLGHNRAINGKLFNKYFKDLKIETVSIPRIGEISPPDPSKWENNDITIFELPQPIQLDSRDVVGYISLWNYFISLMGSALSDSGINTIGLDTATVARSVKTQAYIQELNERNPGNPRKQLLQIEYGHVNSAFENIYTVAASVGKNFITTHHLRDEYRNQIVSGQTESVATGKLELDGWNKTYRFVDVAIRNTYEKNTFQTEIIVCGDNPELVGTKLPNMDWNMLVNMLEASLEGRVQYGKRE